MIFKDKPLIRERVAQVIADQVRRAGSAGTRTRDLIESNDGQLCLLGVMNAAQGGGAVYHAMAPAEIRAAVSRLSRMGLIKISGHNARRWVVT